MVSIVLATICVEGTNWFWLSACKHVLLISTFAIVDVNITFFQSNQRSSFLLWYMWMLLSFGTFGFNSRLLSYLQLDETKISAFIFLKNWPLRDSFWQIFETVWASFSITRNSFVWSNSFIPQSELTVQRNLYYKIPFHVL